MGGNTFGRRLGVIVAAMCALMLIGTLGYTFIESWPIRDGFYMTVITFSTVGYGETQELSQAGRTFTSAFIILCLVTMALWSATLTSCLVEGDLTGRFNERKNRKMISRLKGHTVICGSNAIVGALVAKLLDGGTEVVVIDSDESQVEQLKTTYRKVLTVVGDPTNELTLASTNILDAATVVSLLDADTDNLLVGITAKGLGTDIRVLAKAESFSIANRMRKAGVDQIITPSEICGTAIADGMINVGGVEKQEQELTPALST